MKWEELGNLFSRVREEWTGQGTQINAEGRRQVLICGCEALLTYEPTRIRVRTSDGVIGMRGRGMTMRAFQGNRILVEGDWEEMQWETE